VDVAVDVIVVDAIDCSFLFVCVVCFVVDGVLVFLFCFYWSC